MPSYPVNPRRAASVARRPVRVGPMRNALRRLVRSAIQPVLGPIQRARQTQLAFLQAPPGRIVLLGDSITEGGIWDELMPEVPVLNRGIGGETSAQVLARLDVVINAPAAVLLLVGTNDIAAGMRTDHILTNVSRILAGIEERAPGTPVVVQSIIPRALAYREEILFVNSRLIQMVQREGDHVSYLDLWPVLATPEGALRPELTEDKLHLNGAGYRAWSEVLRPVAARSLITKKES